MIVLSHRLRTAFIDIVLFTKQTRTLLTAGVLQMAKAA